MTYTIINAGVATGNLTSTSLDMDLYSAKTFNLGVQVVASGLTSADSVVKIQGSNVDSDAYYNDITDATLTLAAGASYPVIAPIALIGLRFYRAVYTKNTNAGGTVSVIVNIN